MKRYMPGVVAWGLANAFACSLCAQQTPTPAAAGWWGETTALANDGMEGRDTGSEAYGRAAKYVAGKFAAYKLRPAGDNGTYLQQVPMQEVDLDMKRSRVEVIPGGGPGAEDGAAAKPAVPLQFLQEVTTVPFAHAGVSSRSGMVFVGYGDSIPAPVAVGAPDWQGATAVFFNNTPASLSAAERAGFAARRAEALRGMGFAVVVSIDNPAALEPFHWPAAYSRAVTLATGREESSGRVPRQVQLRISAEAAGKLFEGSKGAPWAEILKAGEAGAPLTGFAMATGLGVDIYSTVKEIRSPNVVAVLPGSDPALAGEYVAVSAHLDGYGYGTPVNGDRLYNGALDDAAYVATLMEMARGLVQGPKSGLPKRSILFCIFTGEEKGLLGSAWWTAHPTVPVKDVVADLNLDQLRPIFPLRILTMEGLTDSTLGTTVQGVAARYGIEIRPDREPERNLFRRADNYNFVRAGVPIASFIFGYDPGSPEERVYRDWYATRYHKPQDDLTTPIDWTAAVKFNDFYRDLTLSIANAPQRPAWLPGSSYAPKAKAAGE